MKHVPHNCPKCNEQWNNRHYHITNVILDYNVVEDNLTVKCGKCGYITTCNTNDYKEDSNASNT